jgi:hypothetical protein
MMLWFKRPTKGISDDEVSLYTRKHGDGAYEMARGAARTARNKGDPKRARHYSFLALRIAEVTKREIGVDTATRTAGH